MTHPTTPICDIALDLSLDFPGRRLQSSSPVSLRRIVHSTRSSRVRVGKYSQSSLGIEMGNCISINRPNSLLDLNDCEDSYRILELRPQGYFMLVNLHIK